jgi:hypothetical protein
MLHQAFLSLLLQFSIFSLASAAPIHTQDNTVGYGAGGGIIGFVVLILDIICFSMWTSICDIFIDRALTRIV